MKEYLAQQISTHMSRKQQEALSIIFDIFSDNFHWDEMTHEERVDAYQAITNLGYGFQPEQWGLSKNLAKNLSPKQAYYELNKQHIKQANQ